MTVLSTYKKPHLEPAATVLFLSVMTTWFCANSTWNPFLLIVPDEMKEWCKLGMNKSSFRTQVFRPLSTSTCSSMFSQPQTAARELSSIWTKNGTVLLKFINKEQFQIVCDDAQESMSQMTSLGFWSDAQTPCVWGSRQIKFSIEINYSDSTTATSGWSNHFGAELEFGLVRNDE